MHGNVQCYSPTIYNEKFELNIWLLGVMAFPIKLVVYKYKF